MQQNEKIGFIGVGLMGHGMAKNILRVGYPVTVIAHKNRVPVENLVSLGAQEAGSLEALAKGSTLVFICAPGSPQVEQIIAELTPNLSENAVIIDCSTSDPTSTLKLAENLKSKRIHMVDAPLGGTPVQAEEGALSAMVGADHPVFARIKPVIESWAATLVHIGAVGDGHRMKLLNSLDCLKFL